MGDRGCTHRVKPNRRNSPGFAIPIRARCSRSEIARRETDEWRSHPAAQQAKNTPANESDRDQYPADAEARREHHRSGRPLIGFDADHECEQPERDGGRPVTEQNVVEPEANHLPGRRGGGLARLADHVAVAAVGEVSPA